MKPILNITAFWLAVLIGAWIYANSDIQQPPGVLTPSDPDQVEMVQTSWTRGEAKFTALAQFSVRARVLSTNHYSFDRQADLSPVDFALGWGRMSDSDILADMHISQSGRFYFWRSRYGRMLPIPKNEIISHSANMHMIPANEDVKSTLLDVRTGEIVTLSGFLVQVNKANGWMWKSSLTRTDTGNGACEVVWVERISHTDKVLTRASR